MAALSFCQPCRFLTVLVSLRIWQCVCGPEGKGMNEYGIGAWRVPSAVSETPEWQTGETGKPTLFLQPSFSALYPSSVPLSCAVWHRMRHEEPSRATDLSMIGENQKREMNSHAPCSFHVVNVGGDMKSHGVVHVFTCWK